MRASQEEQVQEDNRDLTVSTEWPDRLEMLVNLAPPVIEDTLVHLGWLQIQVRQAQPVLLQQFLVRRGRLVVLALLQRFLARRVLLGVSVPLQRFLALRVLLGVSVLLQRFLDRRV